MRNAACFEPWTSIMITADGHVGPCCVFWDPEAQRIQDHSLEEIWNGPYFQKIREQVFSDSLMPYCTQCPDSLKTRSQALRRIMQWEEASPLAKGAMLGKRFYVALREKGVKYVFVRSLQRLRQRFPFQSAHEP
jgi:radical SAM protein with 4Fe4S-binding SPASM domain